jgi:hypothetical protein
MIEWIKMILLGVILPIGLIYLAGSSWISQRAYLPGRGTAGSIWLTGSAARAMTFVHVGAAVIAHAMFFHAQLPDDRYFEKLLALGGILFVGGILATMCLALA